MGELQLRALGLGDEAAFSHGHEVMEGEGFTFGFDYDAGTDWSGYLAKLDAWATPSGAAPGRVPSRFFVADVDGVIVGGANIRFELNDWLAEIGGHIGYGVLPEHRRRGYATEILRQARGEAWSAGIPSALLTCDEDNMGSRKVIEANGGVFERHAVNPEGPLKRRYWVPTAPSLST